MKILLINKFFYLRGGSEKTFFDTADLLRENGHTVIFFSMNADENRESVHAPYFVSRVDFESSRSLKKNLAAAGRMLYSFEAQNRLAALLKKEKPDIAHLHNIHHQISPSILHTLASHRIPVIMTLHDYQAVCPVYTLLSHGRVCEKCAGGKYYHCWMRKCSKDSAAKSLLSTAEMYLHHGLLRSYRHVDQFTSPSRFLIKKTAQMGFSRSVRYLPNFVHPDRHAPTPGKIVTDVIYSGRLSAEKGLFTLLKSITGLNVRCAIYGDGPLRERLETYAREHDLGRVVFAGRIQHEHLLQAIRQARLVVLPSEWYENCPYSILEAFACGRPVIASAIGGIPELVVDDRTGLTFEPGNYMQLRKKILDLLNDSERITDMGKTARDFVEHNFSPGNFYKTLMEIYQTALRTSP